MIHFSKKVPNTFHRPNNLLKGIFDGFEMFVGPGERKHILYGHQTETFQYELRGHVAERCFGRGGVMI